MRPEERQGFGGFAVLFAFAGGALLGGLAAVLLAPRSGAETRRRLVGRVEDSRDMVARVPQAIREASAAAQDAFSAALNGDA
jgi:gas vesicle protein